MCNIKFAIASGTSRPSVMHHLNELDITDVPANLNSVITLGQGGGGSDLIDVTITNSAESTGDITVGCVLVDLEDPDNTVYYSDNVNISIGETKTLKIVKNVLLSPLYVYHQDENNYCDLVSGDCVITDTGDVYFTANGQEAIFKAVYE